MPSPWFGMALVLVLLGGVMGGLRLFQRLVRPHPELVRKLMHVSMGLVALTFPWLFAEEWPVLALAVLSICGLAAVRLFTGLRSHLGGVLGGVARRSLGEFYFALSVATLFCLSAGHPHRTLLYCVPLLILALADAAAALIGIRYGRLHYAAADGPKSAEGSSAFFIVAFFSTHVPLLLAAGDVGRAETLLIALTLGLLITLFEAVAWRGLDNLFIPLAAFLVLKIYLGPPVLGIEALLTRLIVLVVLVLFSFVWRSRTTLDSGALVAAAIVGYLSWALGGWHWLGAPLIVVLTYKLLWPGSVTPRPALHNVHAVVATASVGLIWLFLARTLKEERLYYPFVLAFGAQLGIIALVRSKRVSPGVAAFRLLTTAIVQSWLLLFVPFTLLDLQERWTDCTLLCVATGLVGITVAVLGFFATQPALSDCPTDTARWIRQAAHAGVGSALGLVPLYLL